MFPKNLGLVELVRFSLADLLSLIIMGFVSSAKKAGTKSYPLNKIGSDNVGKKLRDVVAKSKNDVFSVLLSTAIYPEDAHAIDVRYHGYCFTKHVTNVLRRDANGSSEAQLGESDMAAEIDFLGEVKNVYKKRKFIP